MKKYLSLLLVGIIASLIAPACFMAARISYTVVDVENPEEDRTSTPGYVITKVPITLNAKEAFGDEFKVTITFELEDASSTYEFQPNTSKGVTATKLSEFQWQLSIKSLSVGDNVIGIFKIKAKDDPKIGCGGTYSLGQPEVIGKDSESGDSDDADDVTTGYAIPYVALAVGTIGTVTILTTSKRKSKFYKI